MLCREEKAASLSQDSERGFFARSWPRLHAQIMQSLVQVEGMTLWPAIGGVLHCIYTASAGPLSHHHIFCLLGERRSDASTFIFQHS